MRTFARRIIVIALLLAAVAGLVRIARTEVLPDEDTRASDALPLYLSGAAVAAGLDPTQEASLAEVYDRRGLSVGAATFSTLYPATAGVLLEAPASLAWPAFTTLWRWLLLGAIAGFGVAAGIAAGGGAWARLGWAGAVGAVLAWHPVTAECVRLGQVNMGLGAVCAVAMALMIAGGRAGPIGRAPSALLEGLVGGLLGLGAAIKLVPGALLLPLLATRRWRPVVGAAVVGGGVLLLVLPTVPLTRVIAAVHDTLKFQAAIDPDWLVGRDPAPAWMRVLGFVRHAALQWISLGAVLAVPFARPSRRTAVAGMALLCAWLGADAAGFHVLYAPLAYPVFVLLVGRPVAFGALAAAFHLLVYFPGLTPEPRMVLFGLAAWGVAAWVLLDAAARVAPGPIESVADLRQAAVALAGVVTGILLVGAQPGDGPVAAPLPEGQTTPEGPGFIHPNDRVPGAVHALGAGLDRPASTLARPGTIRWLQLYMRKAPSAWRALAARYPARATLLEGRADAVPGGDLRDHSGREVAAWLVAEHSVVTQLSTEGLDLGDLPGALDEALTSGLTDPDLELRVAGEGR